MYKHILIPTDGSEVAEKGVVAGVEYAREVGASVTFFTAVPEYQPPSEGEVLARA
jgi:nucleotide-binding universal stress UspA family protein